MKKYIIGLIVGIVIAVPVSVSAQLIPKEVPFANYIYNISGWSNRKCEGQYDRSRDGDPYYNCHITGAAVHVFDDGNNKCYTVTGDITDAGEIRDVSISCVKN